MSTRPKRTIKPVQRYEPVEQVMDDDYSDDFVEEVDAKKKLRGEFDGFDDEEEEEPLEGPDEYDVEDGFAVPDNYEDPEAQSGNDDDEEEEADDDYEEEDDDSYSAKDDRVEGQEPDVVEPEAAVELEDAIYLAEEEEGGVIPMEESFEEDE